jgi:hypothetical protein
MASEAILRAIAERDVGQLMSKDKEYGGSWKKRGGVGAFMMLARKWDRLETQVGKRGYDIFKALQEDLRTTGLIDDLGDLRRYLMLVEMEMQIRNSSEHEIMTVSKKGTERLVAHPSPCEGCKECTGEFVRMDDTYNPHAHLYRAKED